MEKIISLCYSSSTTATGRTNASLRGMDVGLTTASFATKTQTTISHKHSELYGGGEGEVLTEVSPASGSRKTATLPTKRSTTTLVRPAAAGSTATWSGRGSRETTPTRSPGGIWDFQFQFKSFLRTFSVKSLFVLRLAL